MEWQSEAEKKLNRAPFFIRKKIRTLVETEALRQGDSLVSLKHLQECREKFFTAEQTGPTEPTPAYSVETCMGSDSCPNNLVKDYQLVEQLERMLAERNLAAFFRKKVKGPLKFHHRFSIVIAGCPNACSRPQIVDVGLIGASRPEVTDEKCALCGECLEICRENAISLEQGTALIDDAACLSCGQCIRVCPTGTLKESAAGYRVLLGGKLGRHPRLATMVAPGLRI